MEIIVAIALLWGTVKASEWAVTEAVKFARSGAKRGRAAYAAKHPKTAAPVGRVGQFVGRTTAAGFHGAVAGGRGFGAGMRAGWPEGRQRAYDWQERRQQAKTRPVTEDEATVHPFPPRPAQDDRPAGTPVAVPSRRDRMPSRQTVGATALADDWEPEMVPVGHMPDDSTLQPGDGARFTILQNNGEWETHATADRDEYERWKAEAFRQEQAGEIRNFAIDTGPIDQTPGLASLRSIPGGNDMSIATATGGEVTTFASLIAELDEITKEAAGDLEDATADAARAQEDSTRVETMRATLASLDLDQDTLAEISALLEDSGARLKAAQDRQAAAESRAAHAQTALAGVKQRHSLMQEAVDATEHPAEKAFYGR